MRPDVAWGGTNFLVVWDDRRFGGGDIYGARITTTGVNLDPNGIEVVRKSCEQTYPALAWDGAEYLLAFQEQRTNASGCLGSSTRVSTTVVSSAGVAASTGNAVTGVSSTQANPDVAWN